MVIDDPSFEFLRQFVETQTGIALENSSTKKLLMESRLSPLLKEHGLASFNDLVQQIKSPAQNVIRSKVVDLMTTNESSFFRDINPFEALKKFVLPDLIKKRSKERELTFWSAASSTGQEAYSICMLIHESFPEILSWKIKIIGTDICERVLARAKSGSFNQIEVNRGLSAGQLNRFFRHEGANWFVKDELKRLVEFRNLNLIQPWPALPSFDIVFIRNVLIYFTLPVRKEIFSKIRKNLKPDGYMFLGCAESPSGVDDSFRATTQEKTTFYQHASAAGKSPVVPSASRTLPFPSKS